MFERSFGLSQLTGEKKPRFRGSNETLPMPIIALGLSKFLFGLRSALGRGKHYISPVTLRRRVNSGWPGGESVQNGTPTKLLDMSVQLPILEQTP
jgi:hypothetical protein